MYAFFKFQNTVLEISRVNKGLLPFPVFCKIRNQFEKNFPKIVHSAMPLLRSGDSKSTSKVLNVILASLNDVGL
jgi:hypothetical protein